MSSAVWFVTSLRSAPTQGCDFSNKSLDTISGCIVLRANALRCFLVEESISLRLYSVLARGGAAAGRGRIARSARSSERRKTRVIKVMRVRVDGRQMHARS